jgi:hypothetical protein
MSLRGGFATKQSSDWHTRKIASSQSLLAMTSILPP